MLLSASLCLRDPVPVQLATRLAGQFDALLVHGLKDVAYARAVASSATETRADEWRHLRTDSEAYKCGHRKYILGGPRKTCHTHTHLRARTKWARQVDMLRSGQRVEGEWVALGEEQVIYSGKAEDLQR